MKVVHFMLVISVSVYLMVTKSQSYQLRSHTLDLQLEPSARSLVNVISLPSSPWCPHFILMVLGARIPRVWLDYYPQLRAGKQMAFNEALTIGGEKTVWERTMSSSGGWWQTCLSGKCQLWVLLIYSTWLRIHPAEHTDKLISCHTYEWAL